ncbi:MAG TPA: cysteine--tRNA ligase [Verrucomicrobiae bacterium]|jgi:cysteinyl-tRNA synthetase|nr:cysteine--tRNA ligase [Verrucomicrobiae bacterium]
MALKLFNTLSRSVQEFTPLDPAGKLVGMYCCGPTVYDFAHIGNWRTFVFGDLVRRYLEFKGYAPTHVMNITDIEDKIIRRVRETKMSLKEFTAKYEAEFVDDLKTLNCRMPHQTPRATEFMGDIIALIEKLIQRGIAYRAADGSVYFSIEKYRGCGCTYGQLLKLNFDEMRVGERVKSDDYAKESVADFALWKARVPDDGEVFWPSPWGEGRPGWHIECSAMSMKILGPSFDLHLGGEDLVFPHHEDEIAQSEGAGVQPPGQRFVKHWLHGAHLLVEGKKMSKSLGNFFTLRDLLNKGFSGREIRYLLLTAHYRETFNFTLEGLQAARTALARIDECLGKLREIAGQQPTADATNVPLVQEFTNALDDDLNISGAWGVVFEWVRETNRRIAENLLKPADAAAALAAWEKIDSVLGVSAKAATEAPAEILALAEARTTAKKAKDFKRADAIREELKAKGWAIEDTPKGPKLKKL